MKWLNRILPFIFYAITCGITNFVVRNGYGIELNPIGAIHLNPLGIIFCVLFIALIIFAVEKIVIWGDLNTKFNYLPALVLLPDVIWDVSQVIKLIL